MNDNELRWQVELTKRLGISLNYSLKGNVKVVNEKLLNKVSDAVSPSGNIRLSNPGRAFKVLERLGYSPIDYTIGPGGLKTITNTKDVNYGHVDTSVESDCAGSLSKLRIDGTPRNPIKLYFTSAFDIRNPDLGIRKSHLIELRKAIWHELMEMALLAINGKIFNNPEGATGVLGGAAFADVEVWKYARTTNSTYNNRFFPWTGDKIPLPSHLAGKTAVSLPQKPVKELTMSSASGISGYITDYANRNVLNIKVPPGKTFTWGSGTTTNSSQYKYNALPGRYRIKASLGKQAVDQTVEMLPGRRLPTLKAEFQRDRFGELYIVIEYANWIRGKDLRIKIAKIHSNSSVKDFRPDKTQDKITWGKGHDFQREGYKVEAYVHGNGDRFLADLLNKGELIKPKEVNLFFRSHWRAQMDNASKYVRISYEAWHGYFICKILDHSTKKKLAEFTKTDSHGYIDWGQNQKPGQYIIEVTIDKGVYETKTIEISE